MSHVTRVYGLSDNKTELEQQVDRLVLHDTFIFEPKDGVSSHIFICTLSNLCYAGHRSEEAVSSPSCCQHHTRVLLQAGWERAEARREHCSKAPQPVQLVTEH